MTRRIAIVIAWGLAGLAIAGGLIAGAFALAGEDIGQPATPPPPSATKTKGPDGDDTRSPEAESTETRSPEPGDDHGGSSNSGSGSDDSGSGSSDSGSSSDSGGSGSDDHGDD